MPCASTKKREEARENTAGTRVAGIGQSRCVFLLRRGYFSADSISKRMLSVPSFFSFRHVLCCPRSLSDAAKLEPAAFSVTDVASRSRSREIGSKRATGLLTEFEVEFGTSE